MTVTLYDFQQDLVDYLGSDKLLSRLVGDEMGLGKTPETLAIDQVLRNGNDATGARTLIVAPLSVHEHWSNWVHDIQPGARVCRINRYDRDGFVKDLGRNFSHYICHYEALRLRDTKPVLRRQTWFHIIADEVHRAKNRKALQTLALKALRTKYKTGASGTPADNKPQDLWSILNWLWPGKYTSYWRFINTYCLQETMCQECGGRSLVDGGAVVHVKNCSMMGRTFKKVVGVRKEAMPQLYAEMQPYYMRRLKSQVQKQLPPKYYTDIVVDLYPRQRKAYDQMRKHMLAWVGEHEDQELSAAVVIAQLVRLQQFALASPAITYVDKQVFNTQTRTLETKKVMKVVLEEPSSKLDALEEVILDNPNESFVVFSQSRSMVDLVYKRLVAKLPIGRYTGTVPQPIRDQNVELFQRGDLRVLAGTIAAGGESITLTAASTVCFLDRHWSPFKNIQAEDRLHRIGQQYPVQVIDFTARNTVDLGRRQQIAEKLKTLKLLLGDEPDIEAYVDAVGETLQAYGTDLSGWKDMK
jgi:SNF2 family DNA or RNA helicase